MAHSLAQLAPVTGAGMDRLRVERATGRQAQPLPEFHCQYAKYHEAGSIEESVLVQAPSRCVTCFAAKRKLENFCLSEFDDSAA